MNTNIQALQELYVKLGGSLADTYEDIADGAPVSDYTIIPDMIAAVTQVAGSGGGGGASDPILPVMLVNALPAGSFGGGPDIRYYFNIRTAEQNVAGGMADITYEELTAQIADKVSDGNKSALFLQACFKNPYDSYPAAFEDTLKAIVNVEAESIFALWQQVAKFINECPVAAGAGDWSGDPKVEAGKAILALSGYATQDYAQSAANAAAGAISETLVLLSVGTTSGVSIADETDLYGLFPPALRNNCWYQAAVTAGWYDSGAKQDLYRCPISQSMTNTDGAITYVTKIYVIDGGTIYTFASDPYTEGTTEGYYRKVTP